ncbi:MAG: potassium/proton antiporter [Clostridiales bacterium]|nr:potassium/proton antiporter [Clostridiales bacterium]
MTLEFVLIVAIVVAVCLLASRLSVKFALPTLLIFMVLGMLFGTDGIFGFEFDDFAFAEMVCSYALVFIMFYGGFGTSWKASQPVAAKSFLLASLGVVSTAFITAAFCHLVLGFEWLMALLIGSVLGSTDAASMFAVLKQKKLDLKENTTSLLALESGSNDPASYLMTVLALTLLDGGGVMSSLVLVFTQILYALVFSVILAYITIFILKKFKFGSDGFDTLFVLISAVIAYALPAMMDGNGYLSVYIFGIILGNSSIRNKVTLVHFFDGITGLAQIVIFFLLGLLVVPSELPGVLGISVAIFLFLSFVSRPATVFGLFAFGKKGKRSSFRQKLIVSFAGVRGASSIVFAIMAVVGGADHVIFNIVFCVCLISVALQAGLMPIVSKKLNMLDENGTCLKTFNDYQDSDQMQLLKLSIPEGHPWIGKTVKELNVLSDTLIVVIKRGKDSVVPKGNTKIRANDQIILGGEVYRENADVTLEEQVITQNHKWCNKLIYKIHIPDNILIVGVRRKSGKTIIPKGNTLLCNGDTLILCKGKFVGEIKPHPAHKTEKPVVRQKPDDVIEGQVVMEGFEYGPSRKDISEEEAEEPLQQN